MRQARDLLSSSIQETVWIAIEKEMSVSLPKQTIKPYDIDSRHTTYASVVALGISVNRQASTRVLIEPHQEAQETFKTMDDLKNGIKSLFEAHQYGHKNKKCVHPKKRGYSRNR